MLLSLDQLGRCRHGSCYLRPRLNRCVYHIPENLSHVLQKKVRCDVDRVRVRVVVAIATLLPKLHRSQSLAVDTVRVTVTASLVPGSMYTSNITNDKTIAK